MKLYAIADELHKQAQHASKIHTDLQSTYMSPESEQAKKAIWLGDDEKTQKANETAFFEDFNNLLITEIEIRAVPLSVLKIASDRYWSLFERGMVNGKQPIDEMIPALMPLIHDDISPPEPEPEVHVNGNTPKAEAATKRAGKRKQ